MRKKTVYIIIFTIVALAALSFLIFQVWGRSWRTAKANKLFSDPEEPGARAAAHKIYEDLLVDLPDSPYLLHNLGLSFYKAGEAGQAEDNLSSAQAELEKLTLDPRRRRELSHKFHYHLGSARFKAAEGAVNKEEAASGYQKALEDFKQAIEADPEDLDAKYNYELTLLRLEQIKNDKEQEQKEQEEQREQENGDQPNEEKNDTRHNDQKNRDRKDAAEKNGESPQESTGETQKDEGNEDAGMSKEEAMTLLDMAESGALYRGPVLPETPPAGKDW